MESREVQQVVSAKKSIASKALLGLLGFFIIIVLPVLVLRTYLSDRPDPTPTQAPATIALPNDWPAAVPVVSDATASTVVEDFGVAAQSVTYTTTQTPGDVIAYYVDSLTQSGGTIEATLQTDQKEILSARTADGKRYVVYAGVTDGTTVVTVNVEPHQAADVAAEPTISNEN